MKNQSFIKFIERIYSSFMMTKFQLRQTIVLWQHTTLRKPIANSLFYLGFLFRLTGIKKIGLKMMLKGRRVHNIVRADSMFRDMFHRDGTRMEPGFIDLLPSFQGTLKPFTTRLLILKLPILSNDKIIEKGAIIFKFTETFGPIYLSLDIHLLSKYFHIVLEPSWAGYALEEILVWTGLSPEKVVILSPYQDDFDFLSGLNTNLIPSALGPADWVNPSIFYKIPGISKIYDVIYVANFNPIKRVDRYVRAIIRVTLHHPNFKAALVCAGHGNARQPVLAEIARAEKQADITFFDAMDQAGINALFNQSKVNVLLSLKEGANKGLAEGLFSGIPALLIAENVGGNHAHINVQTGRVVPDSKIEDTLIWFSKHYDVFKPNEWASTHISPTVSTKKLSQTLKEIEYSEGRQWTTELFPKVNQPELAYFDPKDRWLLSKRVELLEKFSHDTDNQTVLRILKTTKIPD